MKTIGLMGGMSWQSTVGYYRQINEGINKALGGLHSGRIVMHSVDFEPINKLQIKGDWAGAATILASSAQSIQAGGADFLVICTNTMHIVAEEIEAVIQIPILHIADATAEVLMAEGVGTVGLLGTAFTMEKDFYKGRLSDKYGLKVVAPNDADRKVVHDVIFQELCLGSFQDHSRQEFLRIIEDLALQGAEAVILGCTEIGMLVKQTDTEVMLCDTTAVHAARAVEYALKTD